MSTPETSDMVALGPELTIIQAAGLRDALADAVREAQGDLSLDLSSVSEFDSSAIQLLLAASRTLAPKGFHLSVGQASPMVRDALNVFGLSDSLEPLPTQPA